MKKFFREFIDFAASGNVLNLAVGVIIGGAFNQIVTSLVADIIMPLVGLLTGGRDISGLFIALDGQSYANIVTANAAGVGTLNYGAFLQNVINFLIIALSIFVAVRVGTSMGKKFKLVKEKEEAPAHLCLYCQMEIPQSATKCPYCTADLPAPASQPAKA